MGNAKLWGGRFDSGNDPLAEAFNASIDIDKALLTEDVAGSIAHSKMLAQMGVLTEEEQQKIEQGLRTVEKDLLQNPSLFSQEQEDIHMNVEYLLTLKIGPVAKKLHTARSRNDQVALDFKMYLRSRNQEIHQSLLELIKTLVSLSKKHQGDLMPGYTHLQRAQPVTLGFHLLCYVEMFKRDVERLEEQYPRLNRLPLGSGALAGLPYPTNRELLATDLGFSEIALHAMDAISDRDYAIEFLAAGAMIQMHLSRLAEELILWSTSEFSFIRLSDAYCTGSSIMPQKRNPDVAELIRGKTGRVYGNLVSLLTTLKALPLAYNKDLQEDKQPVIDTAEQLGDSLVLMTRMLATAQFKLENMEKAVKEGFLNATDLADYWVGKGMAFRQAHECSGTAVRTAEKLGLDLESLSVDQYREILTEVLSSQWQVEQPELLGEDLYEAINPWTSIHKKQSPGSTALGEIEKMIQSHETWLSQK